MTTFVISDLHLMDRQEPFLFNAKKELAFEKLCQQMKPSDQLILAGDIFDLTGMTPCRVGQAEFFQEVVPAHLQDLPLIQRCSEVRSTEDLLSSTEKMFPSFFSCLRKLARQHQLIYIPGNHDCAFLLPEGRQALQNVLGVSEGDIQWNSTVLIGNRVAVVHGNQFDPANRTEQGCQNPGFIFTSGLYHAVLPALKMLGVDPVMIAALPAVRPEEESITGMQLYLSNEDCKKVLLGFARLLQKNDFFSGSAAVPSWFLSHSFPFISSIIRRKITPERVRSILPKEVDIIRKARVGSEKLLVKLIRNNPELQNAVIVSGHTHELDSTSRYVNLGTWIDHIDGLTPQQIEKADRNLPVFVDSETGSAQLVNIYSLASCGSIGDCPVLWSKPAKI